MQASQAKNEVRLPRAVVERSARIQASINARQQPAEPEPSPNPTGVAPPQPLEPQSDPRDSDPAYWKQRFNVVDGRIKAISEERRSERFAWEQQVAELNAQIHTLRAGAPAAPTDVSRFFTPEQVEKFGEEQCRVMATAAEAAADAKIQAAIATQVQPLVDARKNDQAAAAADATQRFWDALAEQYPQCRAVDVTPGWHAWLAETDESSGLTRQSIAVSLAQRQDVVRLAKMFRQYEESTRAPTPPVAPHGSAGNGGGNAPPPQAAAQGGYPSQSEIKDFYKRSAIGKVKDEERIAFEARLKPRTA
jgi:hypothetical protein